MINRKIILIFLIFQIFFLSQFHSSVSVAKATEGYPNSLTYNIDIYDNDLLSLIKINDITIDKFTSKIILQDVYKDNQNFYSNLEVRDSLNSLENSKSDYNLSNYFFWNYDLDHWISFLNTKIFLDFPLNQNYIIDRLKGYVYFVNDVTDDYLEIFKVDLFGEYTNEILWFNLTLFQLENISFDTDIYPKGTIRLYLTESTFDTSGSNFQINIEDLISFTYITSIVLIFTVVIIINNYRIFKKHFRRILGFL